MIELICQPSLGVRLGDYLVSHLADETWTEFRAAIAFVKRSGVQHIQRELQAFSRRGAIKISVGINHQGTSQEGLQDLLDSVGDQGEVKVFFNGENHTFHPKLYLFKNTTQADVLIGSGNLTEGGLYTNYEAGLAAALDLKIEDHRNLLQHIEQVLNAWEDEAPGTARRLTVELIDRLVTQDLVATEADLRRRATERSSLNQSGESSPNALFRQVPVQPAPRPLAPAYSLGQTPTGSISEEEAHYESLAYEDLEADEEESDFDEEAYVLPLAPTPVAAQLGGHVGFLMTLQRTDVGIGQTKKGTSRRSPEVFIPVKALRQDPEFWGYPTSFTQDPKKPNKMDRRGVKVRLGGSIVDVNMMTWPDKTDFRLRSEVLRSAGTIGDILRIERTDGSSGYSYYVEVIPQGTSDYQRYLDMCTDKPQSGNSVKRFGYY